MHDEVNAAVEMEALTWPQFSGLHLRTDHTIGGDPERDLEGWLATRPDMTG